MSITMNRRADELTREIAQLQAEIAELGWDTNFGMYTRNALLRYCRSVECGERTVAFVDLAAIHTLNLLYGYAEVDERVRAAFDAAWRSEHTVARWFSGDEIAIVFNDAAGREQAQLCMDELAHCAEAQGLAFEWALGRWEISAESIEEAMERLADQIRRRSLVQSTGQRHPTDPIADELASLPRQRGLVERLQRRLADTQGPLTLIHADIDGLRRINALHGRQSGDLAVLAVLRAIRSHAPDALLARETDSFWMCLEGTSLEEGFLVAERVRHAVATLPPLTAGGQPTALRISAGIAALPNHASSARELLRHAEEALFRAKDDGGNVVRLAQPQTMVAKTSHYGPAQLARLADLAAREGVSEAELLREALHNMLVEYSRGRDTRGPSTAG